MCTGIRLKAEDGSIVYARTLEFGQNLDSKILMIPRNYAFTSGAHLHNKRFYWKSKYAVVGANAQGEIGIIDGLNEKGLSGGLFYFPDYAQFQEVAENDQAIAPWELITWVLTSCATIDEVRRALPLIKIANVIFPAWNIVPPVHAIVHDATGKSLVVEYVQGKLHMHDNSLGVITNAPTFDWHMTNVKNYLNLTPYNVVQKEMGDTTFTPLGQGSGMHGLPGDFTPPSRFIRALAFSQTAVQSTNAEGAVATAFHILNNFDIPLGVVAEKQNGKTLYERTQWTSACDLSRKRFYIHTYENRTAQMFDLMKMDLHAQDVVSFVLS